MNFTNLVVFVFFFSVFMTSGVIFLSLFKQLKPLHVFVIRQEGLINSTKMSRRQIKKTIRQFRGDESVSGLYGQFRNGTPVTLKMSSNLQIQRG